MLNIQSYNQKELIEIFGTDRMDSIRRKLDSEGYQYTVSGLGNTYKLTVTELPFRFRSFCIEKLGFAPQTDFEKLKVFYIDSLWMRNLNDYLM